MVKDNRLSEKETLTPEDVIAQGAGIEAAPKREAREELAERTDTASELREAELGIEARDEEEKRQREALREDLSVSEPVATPRVAPTQKDRLEKEIEQVLEEDLKELYLQLPPDKQQAFKAKGEETVSKIRILTDSAKVNAKKVFSLIKAWLKILPGVNKFFLEQEAKIKTDKILLVTKEEKKRQQNELL